MKGAESLLRSLVAARLYATNSRARSKARTELVRSRSRETGDPDNSFSKLAAFIVPLVSESSDSG